MKKILTTILTLCIMLSACNTTNVDSIDNQNLEGVKVNADINDTNSPRSPKPE